ncbi:nitroreductase/quinone reductase family protein [Nocardia rhizosphaerihabitans]|uniref:nitroreductase/quinone reductase family protein n=1 Tax=Nocardia rhizosphaerihabitans TaxID=1691570 RepID=UPI0036717BF4
MDFTAFNESTIAAFRQNKGAVPGMPLLLLTTTGARTGIARTTPLAYVPDGPGRYVVYASKLGAPRHPDWYYNLRSRPTVIVEVGAETFTATATTVIGRERERLYGAIVAAVPQVATHQGQTSRVIPVVVLQRTDFDPTTHPA